MFHEFDFSNLVFEPKVVSPTCHSSRNELALDIALGLDPRGVRSVRPHYMEVSASEFLGDSHSKDATLGSKN